MDYGSIVCTPRQPNCNICLIKLNCVSYKKNLQNIIPLKNKTKLKKRKKYSRAYILCNEKNEILVRKRSSTGMLASMLEIPNDQWRLKKNDLVRDKIFEKIENKILYKGSFQYSFSHFDLEIDVFSSKVKKNIFKDEKWIKIVNINKSSFPTVMKKIVQMGLKIKKLFYE